MLSLVRGQRGPIKHLEGSGWRGIIWFWGRPATHPPKDAAQKRQRLRMDWCPSTCRGRSGFYLVSAELPGMLVPSQHTSTTSQPSGTCLIGKGVWLPRETARAISLGPTLCHLGNPPGKGKTFYYREVTVKKRKEKKKTWQKLEN